jgi:hypothetical protein
MQKNWLAIFYRKKGPKMTFDFENPVTCDYLKNFNLLNLSYVQTSIFIIKVCFLTNGDISNCAHDIIYDIQLIFINKT